MDQALDPRKEFIAAKAKETVIAFAGFQLQGIDEKDPPEGLLAVSSRQRSDGSGYLTFTFMIDAREGSSIRQAAAHIFQGLNKSDLRRHLGREFENMIETEVDFRKSENWFMDSFTFYVDRLQNVKKYQVETRLLQAFETSLPIKVEPLEWLPESVHLPALTSKMPQSASSVGSIRSFLKSLFGK